MYRWIDCNGDTKSIYAKTLDELRKKEEEIEHIYFIIRLIIH